jgi:LacI family transcriptional regulator
VCDWISAGLEFEAIFACDDISAIGALSALNRAKLNVPDDVAVVGFDDIEVSRFLSPPLTTIRVPIEEIGRAAIHQLLAFMDGDDPDDCTHFETELVIRRSCGCE